MDALTGRFLEYYGPVSLETVGDDGRGKVFNGSGVSVPQVAKKRIRGGHEYDHVLFGQQRQALHQELSRDLVDELGEDDDKRSVGKPSFKLGQAQSEIRLLASVIELSGESLESREKVAAAGVFQKGAENDIETASPDHVPGKKADPS